MKAKELLTKVKKICEDGHGDSTVYFDSEAVAFNHHLVDIDNCMFEDYKGAFGDRADVILSFRDAVFFRKWGAK